MSSDSVSQGSQSSSSMAGGPKQLPTYVAITAGICILLGVGWMVAGAASMMWLASQVPVTKEDLAWASWLGSPTTALHFAGAPGKSFVLMMAVFGVAMAVAKRSAVPLLVGGCAALWGICATSEEGIVRIGLLDEVVKVGCFVPETEECNEMLGLQRRGEIRVHPRTSLSEERQLFTAEYEARRAEFVTDRQEALARWHSVPLYALLRAPLYMGSEQELGRKLTKQRNEVIALRQAVGVVQKKTPACGT